MAPVPETAVMNESLDAPEVTIEPLLTKLAPAPPVSLKVEPFSTEVVAALVNVAWGESAMLSEAGAWWKPPKEMPPVVAP